MLKLTQKSYYQINGRTVRTFLFFIAFYLYLWLEVKPYLFFHVIGEYSGFPVFYTGWDFFRKFTLYPGGLIEYFGSFLAQFFYFNCSAALILTLLAWSLFACTDKIIKAINAPVISCIRFVAPILLLVVYSQYMHYFISTVALLTALVFVNLHIRITRKNKFVIPVLFIESLVLYYIAGGAYLLFAVLCAIYEFIFKRRCKIGLISMALGIVIPYFIGAGILNISNTDIFTNLTPISWRFYVVEKLPRMVFVMYILYLFIPLAVTGFGLWELVVRGFTKSHNKTKKARSDFDESKQQRAAISPASIFLWYKNTVVTKWVLNSLFLFIITAAIILSFRHDQRKTLFEVDYYLYRKMWPEVIEAAGKNPGHFLIIHAVDRALYHTDRLGYDLIKYHRNYPSPDVMLLSSRHHDLEFWKKANFYFDLGLINKSERHFVESLLHFGEHPLIIQRLALVYIIKGKHDTARIYLKKLAKTIFYTDWANDYLARLESDHDLSSDVNIISLRKLIMNKDYLSVNIEEQLLGLLEDKKNRMAFEYMMSSYLLKKRCDKIVENLYRLKNYQYSEIPKLFQEAVIVYKYLTKNKVDLHGYKISQTTLQRFMDFLGAEKIYDGNKELAFKKLSKSYGDSFFLYYLTEVRR